MCVCVSFEGYRNDLKFSDRHVWTNSADLYQTAPRGAESDKGLHSLPFHHITVWKDLFV